MVSRFLSGTFPELTTEHAPPECWVVQAIHHTESMLDTFSEALQVVDKHGELEALRARLKREHPTSRPHNEQFDARVRDVLTEACAFAWASMRNLGAPTFTVHEGAPDIQLDTGRCVEAKAIHRSENDDKLMKRMVNGEVVSGQGRELSPALFGKFQSALEDALRKFDRQSGQDNVVFFNLAYLDMAQGSQKDAILSELSVWADREEKAQRSLGTTGGVTLVMCYGYNWKTPFREPFNPQLPVT